MGQPVMSWQILTKNPDRLATFYTQLFDWSVDDANPLGYREISTGSERGIGGGIWPAPPEAHSFVQLFVEVERVATTIEACTSLGGTVLIPAQKLPRGEEMAILRDPEGISFGVFSKPAN
ncbi:MAG: VOC family protein [Planctomycetota bacterium]